MKTKNFKLKYIILSSIVIFTSFVLFFVFGLKVDEIVFLSLLGKPEGLGDLFFTLTLVVFGLVFGFIGSILGVLLAASIVKKNINKFVTEKYSTLKIVITSYFIALFLILITLIILGKIIPPCPNCVR